ncbi:hypothetical protein MVEN_02461400 [Mycena venus]|uniref:Ubiquitin 3 binding protein But2 C-terminal domain-containing protein n=1 Tax=Mycena venus TaxID=2733690 RepID=A0A8H6WXD4_9AGAR|nr:hypothetical protein MVEN_02461400 [Mycena venus]
MRFPFGSILATFLALAVSTATLVPTNTRRTLLNNERSAADPVALPRTNAKHLAMGLPPLKPRLYDPLHPPPARRSATPPTTISCNIQFSSLKGINFTATKTSDGIYGEKTDTTSLALAVTFSYTPGSPATQLDLNVPANTACPYFGAVGSGDEEDVTIGPGRTEFVYISALAASIAPNSPPSMTTGSEYKTRTGAQNTFAESAIWSYDPSSGSLTPQWINPTSDPPSSPATTVGFINDTGMHFFSCEIDNFNLSYRGADLSGDLDAYNLRASVREEPTAQEVTLTCVPAPS